MRTIIILAVAAMVAQQAYSATQGTRAAVAERTAVLHSVAQ